MWLFAPISAMKVYSFHKGTSEEETLSLATLTNNPSQPLPENFTICTSHKQMRWNSDGHFYISDNDGKSWLTLRWALKLDTVDIKLWWGSASRARFGVIKDPSINIWYTTCLSLDIAAGVASLAVNGNMLSHKTVIKKKPLTMPKNLDGNLHIGVVYRYKQLQPVAQFFGDVTNIQIYSFGPEGLLELIGGSPNKQEPLIAWQNMTWKIQGQNVRTSEVKEESIFDPKLTYDLAFTSGSTQEEALQTCRKLSNGNMTIVANDQELKAFTLWYQGISPQGLQGFTNILS